MIHAVVMSVIAGAIVVSGLAVWAALGFLAKLDKPRSNAQGRVTLILPLTGPAPELGTLVAALGAQYLKPRRLLIAVESQQDPAYGKALSLVAESSLAIDVVVAGPSHFCAQKNFNILAALKCVDASDDAVVLLDADIVPPPWWQATLVGPLLDGAAGVVTGYRWPTIAKPTLGAHLIAAIDRSLATLPRVPGWDRMVWGGSVALSRSALLSLGLDEALASTLSDDCVIGERVAANGIGIVTRRSLLLPTPIKSTVREAWRFGRRQYQILGLYRPQLHGLSLVALSVRLAAWSIILTNLGALWATAAAALLLGQALVAHTARLAIARRLGFVDPAAVVFVQTLLVFCQPVVDLLHWSMAVAGLSRGHVRWGHVTYRVAGPRDITIAERRRWLST